MSTPSAKRGSETAAAPPKFGLLDLAMTLLALFSVTLVLADIFFRGRLYDWGVFTVVVWVDLAITAVFLTEFVGVGWKAGILKHARTNWFDLLGMVPMIAFVALEAKLVGVPFGAAVAGATRLTSGGGVGGALRLFRFVRIVRVVAAWSRFLRATNMTFGEQVTKRLFDKYRRIIVAELTTPIFVAGITMTQEIVIRMKFLESAGKALDSKRPEIHAAVLESLKKNKLPDALITQPLVDRIVQDVEKAVLDTVVDTLTGPELNKLTQEMIVTVLQNFKEQLTSPEGKAALKGLDLSDASTRVPVTDAPRHVAPFAK